MKNTQILTRQNEILKASKQANTIVLDADFNQSMKIIGKYPPLTQYIKLSDIMCDFFNDMIKKDKSVESMRDNFIQETIANLELYINGYHIKGIVKLNGEIKNTFKELFSK